MQRFFQPPPFSRDPYVINEWPLTPIYIPYIIKNNVGLWDQQTVEMWADPRRGGNTVSDEVEQDKGPK